MKTRTAVHFHPFLLCSLDSLIFCQKLIFSDHNDVLKKYHITQFNDTPENIN